MRSTIFTLLGLTLSFAACGEDDACGDGLEMKDGACVAASGGSSSGSSGKGGSSGSSGKGGSDGSGGSSGASAGETGNDAGAAGSPATATTDFGDSCAEHADCGGDTDYCAAPPGGTAYCTASGCDADASICPMNWACFDVSQFAPGEPWICAPPL
jgi:hypothetical protein